MRRLQSCRPFHGLQTDSLFGYTGCDSIPARLAGEPRAVARCGEAGPIAAGEI